MKTTFINKNLEKAVEKAEKLSPQMQLDIINDYPEARKMFAGLVLLFNARNSRKVNIDDWECDVENHLLKPKSK